MAERRREKLLTIRVNEAEMAMVFELAEDEKVGVSEWIRNIIRREHAIASVAKPSKKRKKQ